MGANSLSEEDLWRELARRGLGAGGATWVKCDDVIQHAPVIQVYEDERDHMGGQLPQELRVEVKGDVRVVYQMCAKEGVEYDKRLRERVLSCLWLALTEQRRVDISSALGKVFGREYEIRRLRMRSSSRHATA